MSQNGNTFFCRYYRISIPASSADVTFYITKLQNTLPGGAQTALPSQDDSAYDDFEINVIDGEYTTDENGNIVLTTDAVIEVTPKTSGVSAVIGAYTNDGIEEIIDNIETVDKHECEGKYVILTSPEENSGALSASFCDICGCGILTFYTDNVENMFQIILSIILL